MNKKWNINAIVYNLFDKSFTNAWESYKSNGGKDTWVNTYNRIEERRRLYISSF